jgi:hypothetical protein
MPFSPGNVHDSQTIYDQAAINKALVVGRVWTHRGRPQSMQPAHTVAYRGVAGPDVLNEGQVVVRDQGKNTMNPYGIAGQQGPAINIERAAKAIRGREIPQIVTIDRRIDPQWNGGTGQDMNGHPVHNAQEQIPGRTAPGMILLNFFRLTGRPKEANDPEAAGRNGKGDSSLAQNQPGDGPRGMANSYSSDIGPGSLNEGPPPLRIPHVWNDGLNAAAGIRQYGFTQQNYRAYFPHLYLGRSGFPTRGIRSLSGVRQITGPTASRVRIPAIFVPSAVG